MFSECECVCVCVSWHSRRRLSHQIVTHCAGLGKKKVFDHWDGGGSLLRKFVTAHTGGRCGLFGQSQ
jgi:hypothetical protein